MSEYRLEHSFDEAVKKMTEELQRKIDQEILDSSAYVLEEFGYVKVVRCRDCAYYDGEPDMESMGEKCWRDPSHSGRSMPTVADGFCWRGKRKEGGE